MNTIQLTKDQAFELIEDENTQEISERPGKHDCHFTSYVAKIGDKHYRFTLEFSYNNGCVTFDYQDTIAAAEVEAVEVKTIEWRTVK